MTEEMTEKTREEHGKASGGGRAFFVRATLSATELEAILPGTWTRAAALEKLVREVRAMGGFYISREALPEGRK